MLEAMIHYFKGDKDAAPSSPTLKLAFLLIKSSIDRSIENYENISQKRKKAVEARMQKYKQGKYAEEQSSDNTSNQNNQEVSNDKVDNQEVLNDSTSNQNNQELSNDNFDINTYTYPYTYPYTDTYPYTEDCNNLATLDDYNQGASANSPSPPREAPAFSPEDDFLHETQQSTEWQNILMMQRQITKEQFDQFLLQFHNECQINQAKHPNSADYKRHFNNWLIIQLEKQNRNESNHARAKNQRRGVEATATRPEDYSTTF
ncbi:MAG: hypothetical protein HUK20_13200 [Fibrobacter sp.]|nr:hypothetical protein [Fibrobacter sp.]